MENNIVNKNVAIAKILDNSMKNTLGYRIYNTKTNLTSDNTCQDIKNAIRKGHKVENLRLNIADELHGEIKNLPTLNLSMQLVGSDKFTVLIRYVDNQDNTLGYSLVNHAGKVVKVSKDDLINYATKNPDSFSNGHLVNSDNSMHFRANNKAFDTETIGQPSKQETVKENVREATPQKKENKTVTTINKETQVKKEIENTMGVLEKAFVENYKHILDEYTLKAYRTMFNFMDKGTYAKASIERLLNRINNKDTGLAEYIFKDMGCGIFGIKLRKSKSGIRLLNDTEQSSFEDDFSNTNCIPADNVKYIRLGATKESIAENIILMQTALVVYGPNSKAIEIKFKFAIDIEKLEVRRTDKNIENITHNELKVKFNKNKYDKAMEVIARKK